MPGATQGSEESISILVIVDVVLLVTGLGMSLAGFVWWLACSRRDPLACAPERPNRFPAEMVMLTVLAYIAVALVTLQVVGQGGGVDEVLTSPSSPIVEGETPDTMPNVTEAERAIIGALLADTLGRTAGVVVCLILAARWFGGGVRRFLLGSSNSIRGFVPAIVLTVVALALCDVTLRATMLLMLWVNPDLVFEQHSTIQALREGVCPLGVAMALRIGAGVVAPLAEEIFFRGVVQTFLLRIVRSRWLVIGLTSVVFAMSHSQVHVMPALFVLSVFLGVVYERSGSLVQPILIHAMFNGKTLLWEALAAPPV